MTSSNLPDITDIANWFLHKEAMPHKKLQKLSYYAVAWNYALFDKPLCKRDEFQAWMHGPVNPTLYNMHKSAGWDNITPLEAVPKFDENMNWFMETVWNTYGKFSGYQLEAMTHEETPWLNARGGLDTIEPSTNIISIEDMKEYYRAEYEAGQND